MIEHKLEVPYYASFEENCAQTRIYSNTPFNMKGIHVLVCKQEKGFTQVFMHLFLSF